MPARARLLLGLNRTFLWLVLWTLVVPSATGAYVAAGSRTAQAISGGANPSRAPASGEAFAPGLPGRRIDAPRPAGFGGAAAAVESGGIGPAKAPRRLVLKFRAGVDACLSCVLSGGRAVGALVPGSQLDALNRRFRARSARPLIRAHAHGLMPDQAAAAGARADRLRARFPARAARAPVGNTTPDLSRIYVLDVGRRADLTAVARAYAADPAVEYCEPDAVAEAAFTPNDPFFASSGRWGQPFADLWGAKQIAAPAAWDTTRGAGIVVAVVDTGIDYNHPDIAANVWTNPGEIPGNGIDDDGNGYVDDVRGWDFADDDADPLDDHLHGTHVAGTIAAVGDNALGIVGVAFESRVMAVRGLNTYVYGSSSDLAEAIVYAVDNGADLINASWAGSGRSATISAAIAYAHAAGTVFVVAAGNASEDTAGTFPANDPNAVTVAANDHLDARASFSNFGVKLDVTAPGGGDGPPPAEGLSPSASVLSLLSGAVDPSGVAPQLVIAGQYLRIAGTSMAAPHVAGTAALVLSVHPEFSVEQVRQVLRTTADDIAPAGPDVDSGYGRVNAARAVAAGTPLVAHVSSPAAGTLVGETVVPITGSAAGPGFVSYTLEYGVAPAPADWTLIVGPVTTPVEDGALGDWTVDNLPDGDYVLRLRAERAGETFVDRVPVTLRNVVIDMPEPLAALRPDSPIEIRGTAAGGGFLYYQVEYRRPARDRTLWRTDGLTLGAPPGVPVRKDLLATLDASDLTAGDRFDFRLTVETASGTLVKTRSGIVIDPTLRAGWPQALVPVADRSYLTVADLDGDGVKEILVGSGDQVVVFEPDGSVRPGWPQSVVNGSPFVDTQASPIVADVAGDAVPEVIATNRQDLFVWSADGVLLPGFPLPVDAFYYGINDWITAGDLDGDGKDEILCSGVGRSEAFFGDGREVPGWSIFASTSDEPFAVADVLGDARVETAMFNSFFATDVARNTLALRAPDRSLLPGWPRTARGGFFNHVGMADIDGDGSLDTVVLNEGGSGRSNKFTAKAYSTLGKSFSLTKLRGVSSNYLQRSNGLLSYADLDRDGRAEAYLYARITPHVDHYYFLSTIGRFVPLEYKRRAPFRPPMTNEFFGWGFDEPASVAIGDVDGDGVQELVAGVDGLEECGLAGCAIDDLVRRAVVVQRADGSLVSQFPKPIPQHITSEEGAVIMIGGFVDDPRYATPAIADLDGDGLKEVVWFDPFTSRLFVWNVAGTPGQELADWPMYHHDPKHTNVLPIRR